MAEEISSLLLRVGIDYEALETFVEAMPVIPQLLGEVGQAINQTEIGSTEVFRNKGARLARAIVAGYQAEAAGLDVGGDVSERITRSIFGDGLNQRQLTRVTEQVRDLYRTIGAEVPQVRVGLLDAGALNGIRAIQSAAGEARRSVEQTTSALAVMRTELAALAGLNLPKQIVRSRTDGELEYTPTARRVLEPLQRTFPQGLPAPASYAVARDPDMRSLNMAATNRAMVEAITRAAADSRRGLEAVIPSLQTSLRSQIRALPVLADVPGAGSAPTTVRVQSDNGVVTAAGNVVTVRVEAPVYAVAPPERVERVLRALPAGTGAAPANFAPVTPPARNEAGARLDGFQGDPEVIRQNRLAARLATIAALRERELLEPGGPGFRGTGLAIGGPADTGPRLTGRRDAEPSRREVGQFQRSINEDTLRALETRLHADALFSGAARVRPDELASSLGRGYDDLITGRGLGREQAGRLTAEQRQYLTGSEELPPKGGRLYPEGLLTYDQARREYVNPNPPIQFDPRFDPFASSRRMLEQGAGFDPRLAPANVRSRADQLADEARARAARAASDLSGLPQAVPVGGSRLAALLDGVPVTPLAADQAADRRLREAAAAVNERRRQQRAAAQEFVPPRFELPAVPRFERAVLGQAFNLGRVGVARDQVGDSLESAGFAAGDFRNRGPRGGLAKGLDPAVEEAYERGTRFATETTVAKARKEQELAAALEAHRAAALRAAASQAPRGPIALGAGGGALVPTDPIGAAQRTRAAADASAAAQRAADERRRLGSGFPDDPRIAERRAPFSQLARASAGGIDPFTGVPIGSGPTIGNFRYAGTNIPFTGPFGPGVPPTAAGAGGAGGGYRGFGPGGTFGDPYGGRSNAFGGIGPEEPPRGAGGGRGGAGGGGGFGAPPPFPPPGPLGGPSPFGRFTGGVREGFLGKEDGDPLAFMGRTIGSAARFSLAYGAMYSALRLVTTGLREGVTGAIEFETALTDLNIATERTGRSNEAFAFSLANLGAGRGFAPGESVAAGARAIGLFDAAEADRATQERIATVSTDVATKVAFLSGQPLEQVQTQIAGITRSFGIAAEDQERVFDMASYVGRRTGRPAGELLQSAGQIGSLGEQAGFDLPQVFAIIARLTATTGQTPQAVSGFLSQVLSRADDPRLQQRLRSVGVETENTTLAQQIAQLSEMNLPDEIRNQIVAGFGRGRSGQALGIILDQFPDIQRLASGTEGAEGLGDRDFQQAVNTVGGQLRVLGSSLRDLFTGLASTGILDVFVALLSVTQGVVDALDFMVDAFNLIPREVRTAAFALLELVAIIGIISKFGPGLVAAGGAVAGGVASRVTRLFGAGAGAAAAGGTAAAAGAAGTALATTGAVGAGAAGAGAAAAAGGGAAAAGAARQGFMRTGLGVVGGALSGLLGAGLAAGRMDAGDALRRVGGLFAQRTPVTYPVTSMGFAQQVGGPGSVFANTRGLGTGRLALPAGPSAVAPVGGGLALTGLGIGAIAAAATAMAVGVFRAIQEASQVEGAIREAGISVFGATNEDEFDNAQRDIDNARRRAAERDDFKLLSDDVFTLGFGNLVDELTGAAKEQKDAVEVLEEALKRRREEAKAAKERARDDAPATVFGDLEQGAESVSQGFQQLTERGFTATAQRDALEEAWRRRVFKSRNMTVENAERLRNGRSGPQLNDTVGVIFEDQFETFATEASAANSDFANQFARGQRARGNRAAPLRSGGPLKLAGGFLENLAAGVGNDFLSLGSLPLAFLGYEAAGQSGIQGIRDQSKGNRSFVGMLGGFVKGLDLGFGGGPGGLFGENDSERRDRYREGSAEVERVFRDEGVQAELAGSVTEVLRSRGKDPALGAVVLTTADREAITAKRREILEKNLGEPFRKWDQETKDAFFKGIDQDFASSLAAMNGTDLRPEDAAVFLEGARSRSSQVGEETTLRTGNGVLGAEAAMAPLADARRVILEKIAEAETPQEAEGFRQVLNLLDLDIARGYQSVVQQRAARIDGVARVLSAGTDDPINEARIALDAAQAKLADAQTDLDKMALAAEVITQRRALRGARAANVSSRERSEIDPRNSEAQAGAAVRAAQRQLALAERGSQGYYDAVSALQQAQAQYADAQTEGAIELMMTGYNLGDPVQAARAALRAAEMRTEALRKPLPGVTELADFDTQGNLVGSVNLPEVGQGIGEQTIEGLLSANWTQGGTDAATRVLAGINAAVSSWVPPANLTQTPGNTTGAAYSDANANPSGVGVGKVLIPANVSGPTLPGSANAAGERIPLTVGQLLGTQAVYGPGGKSDPLVPGVSAEDIERLRKQYRAQVTGQGTAAGEFINSIATQESQGQPNNGYGAVGPMTEDGRAYGKYQILGSHLTGDKDNWAVPIIGRKVSTDEFLNNPALQDAIAGAKLQEYFKAYGAEGAASKWYSGNENNYKTNPDVARYVQSVMGRINTGQSINQAVGVPGRQGNIVRGGALATSGRFAPGPGQLTGANESLVGYIQKTGLGFGRLDASIVPRATADGGISSHSYGNALDIFGTPEELAALAKKLSPLVGPGKGLKELLYTGTDTFIGQNGKAFKPSANVRKNHRDHIHAQVNDPAALGATAGVTPAQIAASVRQEQAERRAVIAAEQAEDIAKLESVTDPNNSLDQRRIAVQVANRRLRDARRVGDKTAEYQAITEQRRTRLDLRNAGYDRDLARMGAGVAATGGDQAEAAFAVRSAQSMVGRAAKGTQEYWDAMANLSRAQKNLAEANRNRATEAARQGTDLTNPLQQANLTLAQALQKQRDDIKRGADKETQNQNATAVRNATNVAQQTEFDRSLGRMRTDFDLGRITSTTFVSFLRSRIAGLRAISKRTDQEQAQLDELEREEKNLSKQQSGMWNIGDIKLPTIYDVRRGAAQAAVDFARPTPGSAPYMPPAVGLPGGGIKAKGYQGEVPSFLDDSAMAQMATTGVGVRGLGGVPVGNVTSSAQTVQVTINGNDTNQMKAVLGQYLGAGALQRSSVSTAKV